jgi:hypothetical protein
MRGLGDRLSSLQLEPQSHAGTAVKLGVPFAIVWSGLFASMEQLRFVEVLPLGLLAGLFFGLILAFFLKGETATLEVGDKRAFVSRVNIATWRLGYYPATQTEDFFTYRPSLELGMAGWRISVQLHDDQAVIFGPKMYVEKLLKVLAEG